jgi:hypothetical protein
LGRAVAIVACRARNSSMARARPKHLFGREQGTLGPRLWPHRCPARARALSVSPCARREYVIAASSTPALRLSTAGSRPHSPVPRGRVRRLTAPLLPLSCVWFRPERPAPSRAALDNATAARHARPFVPRHPKLRVRHRPRVSHTHIVLGAQLLGQVGAEQGAARLAVAAKVRLARLPPAAADCGLELHFDYASCTRGDVSMGVDIVWCAAEACATRRSVSAAATGKSWRAAEQQ